MEKIEFNIDDLIREPELRTLATGKSIVAFSVKRSDKTKLLNTGDRFNYNQSSYEIMNREQVRSKVDYFKFNCIRQESI
ncbi:MAG TPA: hypothetical protein PKY82_22160 [Pyrinomonadaceae bacterium]|nr:hypothetical protein [Pyrinomonadaceae bacterium]